MWGGRFQNQRAEPFPYTLPSSVSRPMQKGGCLKGFEVAPVCPGGGGWRPEDPTLPSGAHAWTSLCTRDSTVGRGLRSRLPSLAQEPLTAGGRPERPPFRRVGVGGHGRVGWSHSGRPAVPRWLRPPPHTHRFPFHCRVRQEWAETLCCVFALGRGGLFTGKRRREAALGSGTPGPRLSANSGHWAVSSMPLVHGRLLWPRRRRVLLLLPLLLR